MSIEINFIMLYAEITDFEKVLSQLIRSNYRYKYTYNCGTSKFVDISGNNIHGLMGNTSEIFSNPFRNHILACNINNMPDTLLTEYPLQLMVPKNKEEMLQLFKELEFLGSKEGEVCSREKTFTIKNYKNYNLR